jgi:multiple sugar transport system substrate-binding protein
MRQSSRTLSVLSLLVAVALFLAACGGTETPTTGTTTGGGGAATQTTPTAASALNAMTPTTIAMTSTAVMTAAATNTPGTPPTNTPVPPVDISAAACGTAAGVDLSQAKKIDVESGATLRVSGWGNPSEQKVTRDMLCRFAQVYTNVKVTYEPLPDDYDTKIKTQISAGSEPDVFYVDPPLVDLTVNAGKLLELTPYMAQAGVNKSDYFQSLINIFSRGDKVYGLPKDFGSIAVFYNKDMVAKTGATAPPQDGNWTWDQYKAFAAKLTQGTDPNTKTYGTSHPADYARWLPFALANGAQVLSADGTKSAINSKAALDALTWYYGFIKDGTAAEPKTLSSGWPGEAFGKGRIGFAIEGGWMVPYLADPSNGFTGINYLAAPLPKAATGNHGDLLFTNAYSARADTKYPKAAAALVLFLAGPVNQGAVMRTGFALPTLNSFKGDPYLQQNPTQAVLYDTANYGVADYYGPADSNIKKAMSDALSALFLGKTDPQGALKLMDDAINQAIANQ